MDLRSEGANLRSIRPEKANLRRGGGTELEPERLKKTDLVLERASLRLRCLI